MSSQYPSLAIPNRVRQAETRLSWPPRSVCRHRPILRQFALATALVSLLIAMPLEAQVEEIVFSWKNQTATENVDFSRDLRVRVTDVNRKDYVYTAEVALIPGQPTLPPGPGPGLKQRAISGLSSDDQTKLKKCIDSANAYLQRRAKAFGNDALDTWYANLEADTAILGCPEPPRTKILTALKPEASNGELSLDRQVQDALRLRAAGPGWTMEIRIKVQFRPQTVAETGAVTTVSNPDIDAGYPGQKDDIKAHLLERVYKINFNPDSRIKVSFGPFISGLGTQRFDQIASPSGDGTFVIGLREDSDIAYGIAAFWTTALWKLRDDKEVSLGPTWGVAYTADRQLSEAIVGMVGLGFVFGDKPALINVGAAVGQETSLAQGFMVGGSIAADAEIPTTTSLKASWFVAVSFSF